MADVAPGIRDSHVSAALASLAKAKADLLERIRVIDDAARILEDGPHPFAKAHREQRSSQDQQRILNERKGGDAAYNLCSDRGAPPEPSGMTAFRIGG